MAAWTLHTYHVKKFRASGPLYLLGPVNSGKTTVLECLEELARRGIRGGSMSLAVMARLGQLYTPSLLVDESQVYNREEWGETQAYLNERYRTGGKFWRMVGEGSTMQPTFFNCYGPTAFAGSHPPWDALTSRALTIKMQKGQPTEQTLTDLFFAEGKKLRAQLNCYAEKFNPQAQGETREPVLVDVAEQALLDEGKIDLRVDLFPDTTPLEQQIKDYRVREVGQPLLACAPIGEPRDNILSYLKDLEQDHITEETISDLADYVQALEQLLPDEPGKISAMQVRDQLGIQWGMVKDGQIMYDKLPKSKEVMAQLKTLGFRPTKMRKGRAAIKMDDKLMEKLRVRFASASSASSASIEKPAEVAEVAEASPEGQKTLSSAETIQ